MDFVSSMPINENRKKSALVNIARDYYSELLDSIRDSIKAYGIEVTLDTYPINIMAHKLDELEQGGVLTESELINLYAIEYKSLPINIVENLPVEGIEVLTAKAVAVKPSGTEDIDIGIVHPDAKPMLGAVINKVVRTILDKPEAFLSTMLTGLSSQYKQILTDHVRYKRRDTSIISKADTELEKAKRSMKDKKSQDQTPEKPRGTSAYSKTIDDEEIRY